MVIDTTTLSIGQVGKTISRLNPIGNVSFDDITIEARSRGEFIDENTSVEIATIEGNKITVTPKIS